MKRILHTLLCCILALIIGLSCTTAAYAKTATTPIIMVHGMGASALYKDPGEKTQTQVGSFDAAALFSDHTDLILQLLNAAQGKNANAESIIDALAAYVTDFSDLACDTNGDSLENVGIINYWTDSLKNHKDYLNYGANEPAICRQLCDQAGAKNVYAFNYDWRLDALENAQKLSEFIDIIKEKTNARQVTLVSGSEGTVVVSAYIDAYKDKKDIKRAVFLDGAFQGVAVTKAYKQDVLFQKDILMQYLDDITKTYNSRDIDITQLNDIANSMGDVVDNLCTLLNEITANEALLNRVYLEVFYPVIGCIPILWEFIPYEDFDACVEKMSEIGFLDKSSGLYEKISAYHQVQGRLGKNLKELQSMGVEIAIVANYGTPGIPVTSAYSNQTDILIDTVYASAGATTAPYGQTLANSGKYVSPDRIIDASTCLLPENTWFIKGIQHMNFWYDTDATEFIARLATAKPAPTVKSMEKETGVTQFINTDRQQNIIPYGTQTKSEPTSAAKKKAGTATSVQKTDDTSLSPDTGTFDEWSIAGLVAAVCVAVLCSLMSKSKKEQKPNP